MDWDGNRDQQVVDPYLAGRFGCAGFPGEYLNQATPIFPINADRLENWRAVDLNMPVRFIALIKYADIDPYTSFFGYK